MWAALWAAEGVLSSAGTGTLIGGLAVTFTAVLGSLFKVQQIASREKDNITKERDYWRGKCMRLMGMNPDELEQLGEKAKQVVKETVEHVDD